MHKLVKSVFLAIGIALLSFVLYAIFFGYKDWKGAVYWAVVRMETPIAEYYMEFGANPSLSVNEDLDNATFGSGVDYSVH